MKTVLVFVFLISLISIIKTQSAVVLTGSGTFIGQDNSTRCKYCPIPCGDLPIFTNCIEKEYKYGCDIMSPCITLKTASRSELRTGFLLCMIYNGCQIKYGSTSEYKIEVNQEAQGIDRYMDKLFYQNLDKRFLLEMSSLFDGNTKESDNNKLQGTVAINLLEEMDPKYNVRQLVQMMAYLTVDKMMTFKFTQDVRDALAKKQTFEDFDKHLNAKIRALPESIKTNWGVSPVSSGLFNQVKSTQSTGTEQFLLYSSKLGIKLTNIVADYNALLLKAQSVKDYDQLVQYRYDYYKNIEAIKRTLQYLVQTGVFIEVSPQAIYPRYNHAIYSSALATGQQITNGYAFFDANGQFFKDNTTGANMNTLPVSQTEITNIITCFKQGNDCNMNLSLGNVPYVRLNKKPANKKFWVLVAVQQTDKNYFMLQKTFTGYMLVTWKGYDFFYESINVIEWIRMGFMA